MNREAAYRFIVNRLCTFNHEKWLLNLETCESGRIIMIEYGKELILDIHNCDCSTFTRKSIRDFFKELCDLIEMSRSRLVWWDDYDTPPEEQEIEPHLKGTSAVQFIRTSNIVIHTLDLLGNVYLNIFSCKDFDADIAAKFSAEWFRGKIVDSHVIERK